MASTRTRLLALLSLAPCRALAKRAHNSVKERWTCGLWNRDSKRQPSCHWHVKLIPKALAPLGERGRGLGAEVRNVNGA